MTTRFNFLTNDVPNAADSRQQVVLVATPELIKSIVGLTEAIRCMASALTTSDQAGIIPHETRCRTGPERPAEPHPLARADAGGAPAPAATTPAQCKE